MIVVVGELSERIAQPKEIFDVAPARPHRRSDARGDLLVALDTRVPAISGRGDVTERGDTRAIVELELHLPLHVAGFFAHIELGEDLRRACVLEAKCDATYTATGDFTQRHDATGSLGCAAVIVGELGKSSAKTVQRRWASLEKWEARAIDDGAVAEEPVRHAGGLALFRPVAPAAQLNQRNRRLDVERQATGENAHHASHGASDAGAVGEREAGLCSDDPASQADFDAFDDDEALARDHRLPRRVLLGDRGGEGGEGDGVIGVACALEWRTVEVGDDQQLDLVLVAHRLELHRERRLGVMTPRPPPLGVDANFRMGTRRRDADLRGHMSPVTELHHPGQLATQAPTPAPSPHCYRPPMLLPPRARPAFPLALALGLSLGLSPSHAQVNPPIPPGLLGGNPTSMKPVPKLPTGNPATAGGAAAGYGTTPDGKAYVPPANAAEWTVLVYTVADNNLEGPLLDDFDEVECIGSTAKVNIVTEIDRWRPAPGSPEADRDDRTNGDWDNARRYYMTKDDCSSNISSKLLEDMPEIDMSHPKELAKFIAWATKKYPAKRYALLMGDHGAGWKGGYVDENAPPEATPMLMSIAELQKGLDEGRKEAGLPKFAVLATDACLMGSMEVADALWPHVDYWASSEELVPGPGYDFKPVMRALTTTPTMDGLALGKAFVASMKGFYGEGGTDVDPSVTEALFDMSKVPVLRANVDKLATLLKGDLANNKVGLGIAGASVDQFGPQTNPLGGASEGYADLVQIAAVLRDTTQNADIKATASAVIASLDAARVDAFDGADKVHARGLSIWLPPTEDIIDFLPSYQKTPFGKSSPWSQLLTVYSKAFDSSVAPKVSNIQVLKQIANPFFMGERTVTAQIDGEVREAVMIVSQNLLSAVVPVEVDPVTDPALFKQLAEGPAITAWKKGTNVVSAKWNPQYITLSGKDGAEFPLSINRERLGSTTFDAEVLAVSLTSKQEEPVLLRFAGSKLLSGFFIDKTDGEIFYTPFDPRKLPAGKVAFSPSYRVVDGSGKSSSLKLPINVKWDKIEDLKINVRPMLPGIYTLTVLAEDFAGHVGVSKITTTLP